jgi:thiol:disulfide interchange protein DsbD
MRARTLAAALALGAAGTAHAQGYPKVQLEAVPEFAFAAPGRALRVAVRLRVPVGFHISWVNPGQSGLPTTIVWRTSAGVRADATEWPYPERDETAGLVSHVYRGAVAVVTRFQVDSSAGGVAALRAVLSWGMCGKTCIPQRDSVTVSLPVQPGAGEATAAWRALAPSLETLPLEAAGLAIRAEAWGENVRVTIAGPSLRPRPGGRVTFFPRSGGVAVVAPLRRAAGGLAVTLPTRASGLAGTLGGLLVADGGWLVGSSRRALTLDVPIEGGPEPTGR